MSFQDIRYEVADHVLTITLNRPDRLNAFTPTMGRELIEAFDRADADDDVRAIVVTGEGRGFCAGRRPRRRRRHVRLARPPGGGRDSPRLRRPGHAAHLRLHQAGDRRDQRPGGRGRDHDDAADGHPPRRRAARRSASSSPAAGSCRRRARAGSCRASSASARRWSGWRPAASSRPRRRLPAGWCAASTRRASCSAPRTRSPARSPTTPRRCRSRWRAGCCGRCWAPSTRWRRTARTRARCSRAASPTTRARASRRSSRSATPQFTDRVSDGLPERASGARRAGVLVSSVQARAARGSSRPPRACRPRSGWRSPARGPAKHACGA